MRYQINLLKKKEESVLDRIIYFSLNYLRYILVITQIVVIFVFFYKFKVDQEIIDLKEAVDQKKEIVDISQSLIKEAKAIELKMSYIKPILDKQKKLINQLNYLSSIFPEPLFLKQFKLTDEQTILDGYSEDVSVIKQFYYQLKNHKKYQKIKLNTLKKTKLGYQFNLVLENYE